MSGDLGRFIAMSVPEAFEIGSRAVYASHEGRPRKPRIPKIPRPNSGMTLGKQETAVSTTPLRPEEVQASLDGVLAKMVNELPTSEARAGRLIKIGMYKTELEHYRPVLAQVDPQMGREVIDEWLRSDPGEEVLKRAIYNATIGADEVTAAAHAIPESEAALAKMIDDTPEDRRPAMAAMIGSYATKLRTMLKYAEDVHGGEIDQKIRDELTKEWINAGDGTHADLKKAVVNADALHNPVKTKMGNASTHVGSVLDNEASPKQGGPVPKRSTEAGAGNSAEGFGENGGDSAEVTTTSGPTDTGGKGIDPKKRIRRKGATGGLGSVQGMPENSSGGGIPTVQNDAHKSTLAEDLVKIAPDAMLEACDKLAPADQVAVFDFAAQQAADLMAWHRKMGDQLQKGQLAQAVQDWLLADPSDDAIQIKKWTAEALASAEEIPLALGKAIMAWQPPRQETRPRLCAA